MRQIPSTGLSILLQGRGPVHADPADRFRPCVSCSRHRVHHPAAMQLGKLCSIQLNVGRVAPADCGCGPPRRRPKCRCAFLLLDVRRTVEEGGRWHTRACARPSGRRTRPGRAHPEVLNIQTQLLSEDVMNRRHTKSCSSTQLMFNRDEAKAAFMITDGRSSLTLVARKFPVHGKN